MFESIIQSEASRVKQRILFVAHSSHRGGAELCLDTMLRHLDRNRFEPVVVFPFEGPMAEAARAMDCQVIITSMCHWLYFQRNAWYWKNLAGRMAPNVARLVKLIKRLKIELVYTNTSAIFESALAARWAGVPHVWHVHEVLKTGNRMNQLLPLPIMKRLIYRWSDRIVFESNAARTVFEDCTPADRSRVIYNSLRLDTAGPKSEGVEDRDRFDFDQDDFVLGFVGQFFDRKNPLLLLRALARLDKQTQIKCLFVGTGPLRGLLEAEVERLHLGERCRIVEFQNDIGPVLNAIDVLVLPSRQESFGLVLVEAGAYSKPVIACRSEGPCEIVVDGETGFLVPQDNEQELARCIERLAASPLESRRLGAAGADRVRQLFHPVTNTAKLEALFDEVLVRTPSRGQSYVGASEGLTC